ncbi:fibronectin type-III domain-containing protein 3A [Scaptodrosophila lebanonensis]|uniref:Fibronectin type-III domain-containing protein 3A n=1 Tax=Drosophila lebanonensis TaxID=7225 RepID=A0A6J2U8I8_DROLE|nr:fibronectin type-III domain-containing protein 3A [Scaptodrosophila lebanonensis]
MVLRLNVAEQQSSSSSNNNSVSNISKNSNINGNNSNNTSSNTGNGNSSGSGSNSNNATGRCSSSTTSSTTSLNSNASPSGIVMLVPQAQSQQQQQQQQQPLAAPPAAAPQYAAPQQLSPSDGSNSSLPASPPLLQQTATPPQGAQIVPPVCALHNPHQQLALMAAMQHQHHHLLPPPHSAGQHVPPHALHHAPPSAPPPHENGHAHIGGGGGGGISPSSGSSSASSVSSISSGSGGASNGGASNGTNGIGPPVTATLPPGPLYIQYPNEFYPPEYYIAPHPHEGICPQHPHHHPHAHHHQPMCAMSPEYGPTAVQMVSQNRPPPPMPVPVQVPQYVNENGTVTHVMLSPQYQQLHPGQGHLHATPFINGNFFTPLSGYPPGPGGNGPPHYHMPPPPPATQQPQTAAAPPQQQQQQQQPPPRTQVSHSPHSPSPPNYKDERSQRQHKKLVHKLERQRELDSAVSTPTHSPSPRRNDINGHHNNSNNNIPPGTVPLAQHLNNHHHVHNHGRRLSQRNGNGTHVPNAATVPSLPQQQHQPQHQRTGSSVGGASSVGTSEDGEDTSSLAAEDEEDYQTSIVEQLSAIEKPEVIDVTSRSAKINWVAPSITDTLLINMRDLRYNVLLSDTGKQCKYKSLYMGEAYECIVQDLQPGQEYLVRVQVHYQKLQGTVSEPTEFKTPPCEPDQPLPLKLVSRSKSSINLRWSAPNANGAPITHYLLEYDEGKGNALHFVELVKTKTKHYAINKLQATTVYCFRLAAINEMGQSQYSEVSSYSTAGNPPTAPKAPTLHAWSSNSIHLLWERRAQDGDFLLQMQDPDTGHGYLIIYKGGDTQYECLKLRRATTYQFRLRAENDAGVSPWSHEVSYKTAAERPGRPGKPHAKGKIHGTHFKARWEPPSDTGGGDILCYHLEINAGPKFERIYTGAEAEAMCERLQPGTTYQLRTYCEGPGGHSPFSDIGHVTTEAVVPAAPPPPHFESPPTPYVALLRLSQPDYNGGAPVLEFEAQVRSLQERSDAAEPPPTTTVYRGKQDYFVAQQLMPGCVYETQVRAINRIGAGPWSQWFRFTAAAAPPAAPEALRVLVKSATYVQVSWQAPALDNGAPISAYSLQCASQARSEDESDPEAETETEVETEDQQDTASPVNTDFHSCYHGLQTSTDLRQLAPFTRYFFRLFASNVAGDGPMTSWVSVRTPAAVPAAPHMQGYEFTANEVTLNWTEPASHGSSISSYNIEYGERTIATPDACTRYTVTGLTPETGYKFRVQAVNSVGAGSFSAYAKLTTQPAPPAPPTLECSGAGHNYIKLKWGDVGRNVDFTKYYVEMYVTRAKQFQVVYAGTNCMCKVHKLQERTAYTFRIYAHTDRAGDGDYSEEFMFETSATLPANIKAPRVVHENSVCLLTTEHAPNMPGLGMQLTLEWQHSKNSFHDRVEYELQYAVLSSEEPMEANATTSASPKARSSSSGSNNSAPVALSNQDYRQLYRGPDTKFTIDNLAAGTCYQFRVCPVRLTAVGDLLYGQPSSALRYQVPSDLDASLAACHHLHALPSGGPTPLPPTLGATQRSSRKPAAASNGGNALHPRSISASAIGSSSSSGSGDVMHLSRLPQELTASNFNACGDPLHLHHHHHHHHHQPLSSGVASASSLRLRGNSSSHHIHHQHHSHHSHHMHHAHHPHGAGATTNALTTHSSTAQHGPLRRFVAKLCAVYTNRKRFSDQEKAVIFVVSFLFVTFLVATLVNMVWG